MKCELCGRQYISLGVHLRHKHAVDPDDYREQFGMLRQTPLVDKDLSEHLSAGAKRRLNNADYKAEVTARCQVNAEARKGKPAAGMSQAGKTALAKRNAEANEKYLKQQAPKVAKILREKKTIHDVRRALGMCENATKKIIAMGEATYSKDVALAIRVQRAAETRRRNRSY